MNNRNNETRIALAQEPKTAKYAAEILEGKWDHTPAFRKAHDKLLDVGQEMEMSLQEEIASLICIHENGIGTRELVEAQEGTDHQGEWQSAMKTAGVILETLRTRKDVEESIRRVVEEAFAAHRAKA